MQTLSLLEHSCTQHSLSELEFVHLGTWLLLERTLVMSFLQAGRIGLFKGIQCSVFVHTCVHLQSSTVLDLLTLEHAHFKENRFLAT